MAKTYLIPGPEQVDRGFRDAVLLGARGVELRSDLHDASEFARPAEAETLASLRTPDPDWLRDALDRGVRAVDLDLEYLDEGLRVLQDRPVDRLLLSTHPPVGDDEAIARLRDARRRVRSALDDPPDQLVCKYAPACDGWDEVRQQFSEARALRDSECDVTFLPQGDRFAGIRPTLARDNATNYIPVGIGDDRPAPLAFGDWLPHLGLDEPEHVEALVGDPVRHSQGALWHRAASEDEGEPSDYLKVELGRDDADELGDLLELLDDLGVRGISVTSPLKTTVLDRPEVEHSDELDAANTLVADGRSGRWAAFDTDRFGMARALEVLEMRGVEPGAVAVIGRGGVSPAVRRAIEASTWELILHASGREGWPSRADIPDDFALVVNAAGNSDRVYEDPPGSIAWIDLHYRGVRAAPDGVEVHLNGDAFFDAQAVLQRRLWAGDGEPPRLEHFSSSNLELDTREYPR